MAGFTGSPEGASQPLNRYLARREDSYLHMFLRHDLPWAVTCPIWRRTFLERIGGFDETLPRLEDPELHIRALLRTTQCSVRKEAPIDCYRRLTPKGDRQPGYYDQCIEAFTKFIDVVDGTLSGQLSSEEYAEHRRSLGGSAKVAAGFLMRHPMRINVTRGVELLSPARHRHLISWFRFCCLLLLCSLPGWIASLIAKTGTPKLAGRLS